MSELFVWRCDVFWHIQEAELVAASQKGLKECNNMPLCLPASQLPLASLLNLMTHISVCGCNANCEIYLSSWDPAVIKIL